MVTETFLCARREAQPSKLQGLLLDLPIQPRGPIKGVHAQGPVDYCLVNGGSLSWVYLLQVQCGEGVSVGQDDRVHSLLFPALNPKLVLRHRTTM